jgi:hypothetical protein
VLGSPYGIYKLSPSGLSDHFPIVVHALRLISHFGGVWCLPRYPLSSPYRQALSKRVVDRCWRGCKSRFYNRRLIPTSPTPRIISMPFLTHISLIVRDYDEAITFYSRLGFEVVEDTFISQQQKRWVTIRPPPPQPLSSSTSAER